MTANPGSTRAPLSVIIPCFNEEAMIGDCLASVAFADEILVVDSFSTDRTVEIACRSTPRVLQHEFWSHGAQNNWAIPQAKHDWVLIVDADERVTPELASEVTRLLAAPDCDGYWIRRRNFFLGRELRHGSGSKDSVLRLFRRDKGRYQEKHVHSQVELNGRGGSCRGTLLHYSYQSLDDFTRKGHRFTRGGALSALEQGTHSSAGGMLIHALGRFLKSYLLKRGFLDGTEGLIYAFMEADHTFLKYAKLWELERKGARSGAAGKTQTR
jgi:glycosyltransferase involved in cell wall biosynthesis